ncbi:hypothetical protein CCHR01_02950 [Colletotrichum chrysophilum]|uniref:Uncharacterized protein n=1 Tax=Colletotrichum chrysophilum TaxID=1836956 RepID=A0AAD9AZ94_9PEZI|nr:hypothetical protein CCHR01_02950 [Colletotrichum chrysophilum]
MAGCTFLGAKKPPTPTHPQRAPPFCNNFGILEIEITNLKGDGAWLRQSSLHQRAEFEIQERRADMDTPVAEGAMRMWDTASGQMVSPGIRHRPHLVFAIVDGWEICRRPSLMQVCLTFSPHRCSHLVLVTADRSLKEASLPQGSC